MNPILQTSRLAVRRFDVRDGSAFSALYGSLDVMQFIADGMPWSAEDIAAEFQRVLSREPVPPLLGRVAVVLRENGAVVGWGLLDQWEDLALHEVGFGLLPTFHGKGLGLELATSLVDHYRADCVQNPLVATVHRENQPSVRILHKLGFQKVGIARREARTKDLYVLGAPDLSEAVARGIVEKVI